MAGLADVCRGLGDAGNSWATHASANRGRYLHAAHRHTSRSVALAVTHSANPTFIVSLQNWKNFASNTFTPSEGPCHFWFRQNLLFTIGCIGDHADGRYFQRLLNSR